MQIVLGIDPGSIRLGYAVLAVEPKTSRISALAFGVIKNSKKNSYERLGYIHQELEKIIKAHQPDQVAIEKVFLGKNPQSVFRLGLARGAALARLSLDEIPINEYAPKYMKKFVTGSGQASKEQIQWAVKSLLHLNVNPSEDAADALGLAYVLARQIIGTVRSQDFVIK